MLAEGIGGPSNVSDGATHGLRVGKTNELIIGDGHPRFYEACSRGMLFAAGAGTKFTINNATYTTATLDATVTPIIGLYNPIGSGFNLVLLQAILGLTITAATKTGGGPFAWATGLNTGAVTVGAAPFNRKTMQTTGSVAKDLTNLAPTNLTPSLVVRFASSLFGGSSGGYSQVDGTIAAPSNFQISGVENFDGSWIVPPGGVIALLATTTPVAHSAASAILWEEVPII